MDPEALRQLIYNAARYMDGGRVEKAIATLFKALDAAHAAEDHVVVAEAQCFLADVHFAVR